MNAQTGSRRKFVYLAIILLLLFPIVTLGMPSAPSKNAGADVGGGLLSSLRRRHTLGQTTLGNVDPASATMSFVLLGFRGIATSMLWMQAHEQQKRKDWGGLDATTESIILLQPHFLKVWEFHSWNLSYNVAAEWDGVSDRYFWLKRGIKFLKKGVDQNQNFPVLYWFEGDTIGRKLSTADEWVQYRRYFKKDPDERQFPNGLDPEINPDGRDNQLVSKDWLLRANEVMDATGNSQNVMAHYLFRKSPYQAQLDYGRTLLKEGVFTETMRTAWATAYDEWTKVYGREEFDSPAGKIHLELTADEYARWEREDSGKPPQLRRLLYVRNCIDTCNYEYWKRAARFESDDLAVEARKNLFEGERAYYRGDVVRARSLLLAGMRDYEKVLDKPEHKSLQSELTIIEDAVVAVLNWQACYTLEGEDIPEEYPLKKMFLANQESLPEAKREIARRRRLFRG